MDKKVECEITQDLLLGYSDNVLNDESKKLVEKHLLECKECQRKYNEIQQDIKDNENNENNEKKQIDYLKKIKRTSIIKSIIIAIGVILFICFIIYLRKFIIVNDFMNKAKESLEADNFYKETIQVISSDSVALTKTWYKDGKFKIETEIYSEAGVEKKATEYATVNSNERTIINHQKKLVRIERGGFTKLSNEKSIFQFNPFVQDYGFISKIINAFFYSIHTSYHDLGREYYVLNPIFDKESNYEVWIDKDIGLPLKISNYGKAKTFFDGTSIVKEVSDMRVEYKYEFNIVKDEDVTIPDYTGYEIKYINTDR